MNASKIIKIASGVIFLWMALNSCIRETKTNAAKQVVRHDQQLNSEKLMRTATDSLRGTIDDDPQQEVPVLCYHHIKKQAIKNELYTVSETEFAEQLKMLSDSGYHTVLPGQLLQYLAAAKPLPPKPVMLSFDDTRVEHFTIAASEMNKYGFKGVFFIMTIGIGKKNYMTSEQIKALSDNGHVIGCHTWDHHKVKTFQDNDWNKQIDQPKQELEKITGKTITYFAYPYGLWNDSAIGELKKRGFKAAFQLTGKQSQSEPLYTIRRMIVPGGWSPLKLKSYMNTMFQ